MATPIVKIDHLDFGFRDEAGHHHSLFQNFDLEITRGSFTCLMGPSGCGKTTLIRLIAGLLKPQNGKIEMNLEQKTGRTKQSYRAAYMFQDARLLPWRRILDNVLFATESRQITRDKGREIAMENLALVGLQEMAQKFPHQLSGGQRQRVALARALSFGSEFMLMDEPFAALDLLTRQELQDDLLRVQKQAGLTILFITHDKYEAHYLADRILHLDEKARLVKDEKIDAPRPRPRPQLGA